MPKLLIERSLTIPAPLEQVYALVRDFQHWPEWSPWLIAEPEAKTAFAADGRSYTWNGEVTGSGRMELIEEDDKRSINYRLTITKPWKSKSDVRFVFSPEGTGTRVLWRMDGTLPFFMFFLKGMMESLVGMDYDRGLNMLSDLASLGRVPSHLEFMPDQKYSGCQYIGLKRSTTIKEMPNQMEADFKRLFQCTEDSKLTPTAPPFSIYSKWKLSKGLVEYTVGLPLEQLPASMPDNLISGKLPACKAYAVRHTGPYRHLGNAWSAGMLHGRAKVFSASKACFPFEVYDTQADHEPESEIQTTIYFPAR
ncbi:MAG: SRPBCC family protein [Verrucomicrobiota bacterium]